jgi:hypothetical protein
VTTIAKRHASVIDEYEVLDRWYSQNKPKIDRRKTLADQIQTWYRDDTQFSAAEPIRLEGNTCYIDLAPRKEMRRISSMAAAFAALRKAMGLGPLIDALTITFKLLDRHVPEAQQAEYVVKEPTGPRTITVVAKTAIAKTAA